LVDSEYIDCFQKNLADSAKNFTQILQSGYDLDTATAAGESDACCKSDVFDNEYKDIPLCGTSHAWNCLPA
jgi:hypothetical protein